MFTFTDNELRTVTNDSSRAFVETLIKNMKAARRDEANNRLLVTGEWQDSQILTYGELKVAVKANGWPEYNAKNIFDKAVASREPEYEVNAVYQSPDGQLWKRGGADGWLQFGTTHISDHNTPLRPLKRI